MEIVKVIGIGIIGAVLTLFLNEYKKEYGMFVSISAGVIILFLILDSLSPVMNTVSTMMAQARVSSDYLSVLIKALGICFLTQMAVDACIDSGNKAIASKIELAGRIAILVLGLPLFITLLELAANLISL